MGWPVALPSRLSSRKTHCAHLRWPATNLSADSAAVSCCAVAVLVKGRAVLMPSTPSAYPPVISRHLASFRVVKFYVSAAQVDFWAWFDSRQLHQEDAGQSQKPWPAFFFIKIPVKIRRSVPVHGPCHARRDGEIAARVQRVNISRT